MKKATLGDRSLFPTLASEVYLSHCAISPVSLAVREAVEAVAADYGQHGLGAYMRWMEQRGRLKILLAGLIGARAEDLALTPNTTFGVSAVAMCFPWERGDKVVVFEGEFPTNVTPWQRAAALFGLEVVSIPVEDFAGPSGRGLSRLEEVLRAGVRLVAVSAVQFQTGLRMPVATMASLCHDHGAEIFVDAIQAVGVVPVDVVAEGVDYLTCGSHKWLMGTEGAGFLYAAPERVGALRPHLAGWLSHEDSLKFLFEGAGHLRYDRPIRRRIDFLEAGAPNTMGFAALEASSSLIAQLGVAAVWQHVDAYLDTLEPLLEARGFESLRQGEGARSGILSSRAPEAVDVLAIGESLRASGVGCTTPDGLLRLAPHWPNNSTEIPKIIDALDAALDAQHLGA